MMSTFTPSKPCEPAQSISLSKCPVFPTNRIYTWTKVMMLQWRQRRWTQHRNSSVVALHVRCPKTYEHSHCSRPVLRCREAESAVSQDLTELPSMGSKRKTSATVHTYHTCGCRDNPQQQMAPRRRGSRVPSLRTVGSLGPRPFSYAEVHAGSRVLRLLAV